MNFITRKPTLNAGSQQRSSKLNDRSAHAVHTADRTGPISTSRKIRGGHAATARRAPHHHRAERVQHIRCTPSQRGCIARCVTSGGKWLNLEGTGLQSGSFVRRSRHADRPAAHGTRVLIPNSGNRGTPASPNPLFCLAGQHDQPKVPTSRRQAGWTTAL